MFGAGHFNECEGVAAIEDFVHDRFRLHFPGHKKKMLRKHLAERAAVVGAAGPAAYLDLLMREEKEEKILLDLLTTNETYFFRIEEQFRYLAEKIVPEIEAARNERMVRSWGEEKPLPSSSVMKLRVLCAGCSTGEEPYSVAMTLLEALRYPRIWDVEVLAGDISQSCLEKGSRGVYADDRVKGIPPKYLQKYLERVPGGYRILPAARRFVRFEYLNLGTIMNGGTYPGIEYANGYFDLIFCRNVMIYFSEGSQQNLVDSLYRSLAPGGYLFTGDAEPLHLFRHDFLPVPEVSCFIYRKGA